MIMAIPPYVSLLSSSVPHPIYPSSTKDEADTAKSSSDVEVTSIPKKRSFDVAFLISQDDKTEAKRPTEPGDIRSAFRKVGIGLGKFPESRSPSPIDPTRTPSPYDEPPRKKEMYFAPRARYHGEKTPMLLSGNFPPVGLRGNFIPTPIFAPSQLLPTSFVAAASLLPPSLAALTLPAQNVCAKCNVSFRMTSDLVYHMRSHHKNDHTTADQLRRRRELDKLKCPVCNESFRERHHLTRHMTAHQDKEGDNVETSGYRGKQDFAH